MYNRLREYEIEEMRAVYARRLDEKLGAQQIGFEGVVQRLEAKIDKVQEEHRSLFLAKIEEQKARRYGRSAGRLLANLAASLGTVVLGAMGFPTGLFSAVGALFNNNEGNA